MKRVLCAVTAAALAAALGGCSAGSTDASKADPQDTSSTNSAEQTSQASDAKADEDEPIPGQVDAKTGAYGPVILYDPYASGIHHAWLKVAGYPRMELEIYATDAPETSALFCKLVRKGYYDGLQLEGLMPNLYAELGDYSAKTDGRYTVTAEFEEAGYSGNHLGLKRGVIAMSRTDVKGKASKTSTTTKAKKAKVKTMSDAAHLYVFLTNASYFDGKYAGFAKITSGITTFDEICADVQANAKTTKKGKIKNVKDCPTIKYIKLED